MSNSTYPAIIDAPENPSGNTFLVNTDPALAHHFQHSQANDAIVALETKLGVTASTDPGSVDYKIRNGGSIRKTVSVTTNSIIPGASDNSQRIATGKKATVLQITTSAPAWVRLYCTVAAQTADAARKQSVDPVAGAGVLLEVITAAGAKTINLSPTTDTYNMENPPLAVCPITVTNLDTIADTITVSLVIIPEEG